MLNKLQGSNFLHAVLIFYAMVQLRKNHNKGNKNKRRSSAFVSRAVTFVIFSILLLYALFNSIKNYTQEEAEFSSDPLASSERYYLPEGSKGQVVHHAYYSLAYNEKNEQADWVAYELTESSLKEPNVPRAKRFKPDFDVKTKSAYHKDYTHSGYTRGHMAPAADMAFNEKAMQESFFMSNMSPQTRECNGGIWKELEENVRDWAYKNDAIYVISGPIFESRNPKKIGQNKVAVPDKFYKILLDITKPEKKGIGFLIPNEKSSVHLKDFAVSIDSIESLTSFDFFANLLDEDEQDQLESNFDLKKWKISNKRYQLRVDKWNNQ